MKYNHLIDYVDSGCLAKHAIRECLTRLAELEDKIEQGTLKEVVRCKDCRFLEEKHYEDEGKKPYIKLVCKLLKKQIQPNDFCSYAEKRLKELQG